MAQGLGESTPLQVAPGTAQYQKLLAAGFTQADANQWAQQQTTKLQQAGFKPSEIDAYWGNQNPIGSEGAGVLTRHFQGNLADNISHTPDARIAKSPTDAFAAGWNMSATGLILNRKPTDVVLPQNASLVDRVLNGVGQFAGDAPVAVAGFFGGGAAGVAAGGATGPGAPVASPVLGLVGAGAGAAAAPEATRQTLLDAYAARDGRIKTWQDAVQVVTHSLVTTGKQALIGGVAAPVGGAVGGKLAAAGASPLISGGADAVTQAVTATGAGAAMDGHMPDAKDFEAGAILALGFHTAGGIAELRGNKDFLRAKNNLETIYRQTGVPPWEAAQRAQQDPNFRQEIFTQDVNGETVAPNFRNIAPDEPEPFKPAPRGGPNPEEGAESTGPFKPAARPSTPPAEGPRALPASQTIYAGSVDHALDLLSKLEGSADNAVSPVGAIGKYQIMPGTARYYMGKDFDVKQLFDPAVNRAVAERVVGDLYRRYNGNMTAISIAYNAGPGRAGEYLKQGHGTMLEAERDPTLKSGWRYTEVPADKNEAFLPLETQRYLARARLFMGGKGEPEEAEQSKALTFPTGEEIPDQEEILGEGGGGQPPAVPGELPEGEGEPKSNPWMGKSEEALTEAMMRNVGEQPEKPGVLNLDRVLSQFVSELTPARRLDDRLIKEGSMDRTADLGAEDMFRQTYASDARAGVFIRYGAIDPITLDIKPGSKSVLDATRMVKEGGGNMDGWVSYMLAHRTVDKAEQGIDTGMSKNVAEAIVNNKKMTRKYEQATRTLNDVFNSVLEYSRDSGVHSQAQVDAMIRDNPTYISMRRVMGDDEAFDGKGRGFKTRDALRRMEGSNKQIVDPIAATLDNMRVVVRMADRNRAIGHIIGMVERGEADLGLTKIEDQQTIKAADEKVFKPYGLPPEADPNATYGPLIAMRQGKASLGPNDFLFFRDGKAEVWHAKDPLLAQLMRGADSPGQMNVVTKTFQLAASLERAGIVVNPDFPTRVQMRHQVTAFIADPLHPPPFVTWLRGLPHVLKQDEVFKDAVAKGAMGVALADMDVNWLARDMDSVFAETGTWNGAWNAVKHPLQFAQLVSERMDAAARIGYTLHASDKGVEPIKAATMSRKAYLDYAERGTAHVANWMATVVPFFRPHLLGLKQGWEAVANDPISTLKYATLGVAVPMAAMYALNWMQDKVLPDDRKYANLPQWEKDGYFISPEIAGVRLKLRTPPNFGFLLGGTINRALDKMSGADPHAFDQWAQKFLSEFIPPLMPTVAQAPVEVVTNHNFFTGRALIPDRLEKASGYMQYTPYTSEVAKALSRALGPPGLNWAEISPIDFDHIVQGYTGSLGADALHALDWNMGEGAKKPWELADIPFVGSFLVRNPQTSAQPIEEFYQRMSELEAKQADFGLAMQHAEQGDASEIDTTAPSGQYASAIAPIKKAIEVQSQIIQGIYANKEMSPDEKREAVDQVLPGMIETAKQGLQAMDDLGSAQATVDASAQLPPAPPSSFQGGQPAGRGNVAPPPDTSLRGEVPVS